MRFKYIFIACIFALSSSFLNKVYSQCPMIGYEQASTNTVLMNLGWDTMITCQNQSITLVATTFITPQMFNGYYTVESIPYDPPDTTFYSTAGGGHALPISTDDNYDASALTLPFEFVFFGRHYTKAVAGGNGVVSFGQSMAGQGCPWALSGHGGIPNSHYATTYKNAIFGILQDIHPGLTSGIPHQGIYVSVYDSYPCRKMVVSYLGIPHYSSGSASSTEYTTAQIVCYEGTNIIDVHVKRRVPHSAWDGGLGIIGIQDSVGTTATPPHAFYAPNRNPFSSSITTPEAWRFTPQGTTIRNINWYYGTDTSAATGRELHNSDSISVWNDGFGGDSAITVSPTVPTTYTMRLRYTGANGIKYDLSAPVFVGVNNEHSMNVTADTIVCKGEGTSITINTPPSHLTTPDHNVWTCNNQRLRWSVSGDGNTVSITPNQASALFLPPNQNLPEVVCTFSLTTAFKNGCNDSATVRIHFINRIDDTIYASICEGQTYTFNGHSYNTTGTHSFDTVTAENCPYTKTLRLAVHYPNDTVIKIKNCQPITWQDGITYSETTTTPTLTLHNQYGCDSLIHLNFTLDGGLTALINVVPESATLDQLHIQLKDVSLASDARLWRFPDGTTDTNVTCYYEYPTTEDSVNICLVAIRNYNEYNSHCYDTACVTIPLLKEAIWFPNAFTPRRDNNNVFQVIGIGIQTLEVQIFDRKGNMVYKYEGPDGFWDGTNIHGKECPSGAYVYLAKYSTVLNPNNFLTKKGTITLIK